MLAGYWWERRESQQPLPRSTTLTTRSITVAGEEDVLVLCLLPVLPVAYRKEYACFLKDCHC